MKVHQFLRVVAMLPGEVITVTVIQEAQSFISCFSTHMKVYCKKVTNIHLPNASQLQEMQPNLYSPLNASQ